MKRIAEFVIARVRGDALGQASDPFVREDPTGRRANLARVGEGAVRGGLGCARDGRVLEDQNRAVAPELQEQRLAGAALGDPPAGRRAAGESDRRANRGA